MAGAVLKRAIADSTRANGLAVAGVAVMSLANGYISYVTTAAEYSAQDYEGASTLFGPGSAAFLARRMGQLAAELARAGGHSPPSRVTPFTAYPGFTRAFLPRRTGKPPGPAARRFLATACRGDTLVSRWVDAGAAWLPLDTGQLLVIERQDGSRWTPVAWDDDPRVEVRIVKRVDDRTAVWEVRWTRPARGRPYRVVLRERGPFGVVADTVACP